MKKSCKIVACILCIFLFLTGCDAPALSADITWPESVKADILPVSDGPVPTITVCTEAVSASEDDFDPNNNHLTDLNAVSRYLNCQIRSGNHHPEFYYTGTESLTPVLTAQMTCALFVEWKKTGKSYDLTYVNYPGDRIVAAWKSGDLSGLSAQELEALKTAEAIVSRAKAAAETDTELEIALHDWITDHVQYCDSGTEIKDFRNPPRHLTAFGALLDGTANCQGYADGFYTLASLAGFQVDRMCVHGDGVDHIVNTILLDGQWYVVDTTYDDYNDNVADVKNYHMLNAGKDFCQEYSWEPFLEHNPIADTTDENYFYFLPEDGSTYGYPKAFYTVQDMADSIWSQYVYHNRTRQALVLLRGNAQMRELSALLEEKANEENIAMQCKIWCSCRGENTYFYVSFTQ